jgi:NADH:ubiquinone reductase (H+-translocating)
MMQPRSGAKQRPKVVVVGGGFAGLSAVRQLSVADVDVLLLDRNGYTTFQPLLYQVATGGLNPGDVTYALRAFTSRYRNTRFRRDTVTKVDTEAKLLHVDEGDPIPYDFLILCCGVTANYFGISGADDYSHVIYTRGAAIDARDLIVSALEDAAQGTLSAKEPVFVVVGGGATGVEMAGTLAELRNGAVPIAYPDLDVSRVKVVMVEMADEVLAPFHPKLRAYAAKALRERGIDLRLGTSVKEVHADSVVVQRKGEEPETIPAAVVVWATGVTAAPIVADWGLPTGKGSRIETDADLRVKGHPEIFAVGDVAVNPDDPLPQLAQPAIQGGKHAGVQIRRILAGSPTEPFSYHDKGTMATIGRSDAVVQLPFGLRMKGWPAWLAWLGLHLIELMGGRNRIASMINLSVRYLSWPRSVNMVIGDHVD